MGAKDASTKVFLGRPEVFAEIFNFLFRMNGLKYTIVADSLVELDSTVSLILPEELQHLAPNGKINLERRNDIVRLATITNGSQSEQIILCVESQSFIRYCQPHQNVFYYALREEQEVQTLEWLHEQEERANKNTVLKSRRSPMQRLTQYDRLPVIMVCVVYFGFSPWNAPNSLHACRSPFFNDMSYYLTNTSTNVLALVDQDDHRLSHMKTELRLIATLLKHANHKRIIKDLLQHDSMYQNLSGDAARVINALFDLNLNIPQQTENNTMHPTFRAIFDEERQEGRLEGRAEGRLEGRLEGKAESVKEIALRLIKKKIDRIFIQQVCNINEEQLKEYEASTAQTVYQNNNLSTGE